ncbi:MAG TPA: hypothetical protein VKP59_07295 [Candidatus Thermoplasmatota archaeon]|nr:hypothetical protein [Candidatus Thermoplasmatota archaeon]
MIDDDDIPQAIFKYAYENYADKGSDFFEKFMDEFPEKDWDLDEKPWMKNYLCWLFYEKVLPGKTMTVAEEFAAQSKELSEEMKKKIFQMRNTIRSDFVVLSVRKYIIKIKDMHTKREYTLKQGEGGLGLQPNMLLTGRIHPFGKYYRTTGIFTVKTTPLILDPTVLMHAYEHDQVDRFTDIKLHKSSKFKTVMKKYPAHWIDWMCDYYEIEERLKKDKISEIEKKLILDLPSIIQRLSTTAKDVLYLCMKNDGMVKYRKLNKYDDELGYFWEEQSEMSTIGELRQKALLFIGKMRIGQRNFTVAFIPVEIRNILRDLFDLPS